MKFSHDLQFNEDLTHVDLTPLIDVIFMLVIFFILTMSFTAPILNVQLPKSTQAVVEEKVETLQIAIKKDGNYYYQEELVNLDKIEALLCTNPKAALNIYADKEVPFFLFVKLIDLAKAKRNGKFSITTQR